MENKHSGTDKRKVIQELIFQILLFTVVFLFYVSSRTERNESFQIHAYDFWFFLNYALAVCVINYFLLPLYFYRKKYLVFGIWFMVVIALVIVIEEEVIEYVFFPTTRGAHFQPIWCNLAGILPIITILSGFKFAWDALQKQREVELLKSAVKESELQFLKSQINPHFLFNNLNNLYAYALEKSDKAPEIILELSAVLRYTLYECSEPFVSLQQEVEHLEHFINLSKLQLEDRGEVSFHPEPTRESYLIAPLILSVFIENAFKHSISSQYNDISIVVETHVDEEGVLHFVCENTYSTDSNTASLGKGIGLENVRKRLELIYPNQHTLTLNFTPDHFRVYLKIRLKTC